jgi:hypothetical protein
MQLLYFSQSDERALIDKNRRARVDDIETGLRIAINRANKSDPVVPKVQQVLYLLRNSRVTIKEAATSVGVPVEVISELGRIALNDRLLRLGQQRYR